MYEVLNSSSGTTQIHQGWQDGVNVSSFTLSLPQMYMHMCLLFHSSPSAVLYMSKTLNLFPRITFSILTEKSRENTPHLNFLPRALNLVDKTNINESSVTKLKVLNIQGREPKSLLLYLDQKKQLPLGGAKSQPRHILIWKSAPHSKVS